MGWVWVCWAWDVIGVSVGAGVTATFPYPTWEGPGGVLLPHESHDMGGGEGGGKGNSIPQEPSDEHLKVHCRPDNSHYTIAS